MLPNISELASKRKIIKTWILHFMTTLPWAFYSCSWQAKCGLAERKKQSPSALFLPSTNINVIYSQISKVNQPFARNTVQSNDMRKCTDIRESQPATSKLHISKNTTNMGVSLWIWVFTEGNGEQGPTALEGSGPVVWLKYTQHILRTSLTISLRWENSLMYNAFWTGTDF